MDGVWTISVEYTREEDGVPRTTGGRQRVRETVLREVTPDIGDVDVVTSIAGKVYLDVREALVP